VTEWTWPTGVRGALAVTFDFDAEEVWLYKDPEYANRPGALSQGTYGAKVGVPRLLELLARHEIKATFFTPGRVAERHPGRVEEILAGGHTLGFHGYTHHSPVGMSREEENEELSRGLAVLRSFGGEVRGYRSPSWDLSPNSLDLMTEHGLVWSSNFMDDVRPYVHPGREIVELPVQWMLDDAAYFWFSNASFDSSWINRISTTSEVREIWQAEALGIADLGGACVLTMHPQVIGRPSRLAFLDSYLSWAREQEGLWIATCEEIVARVIAEGESS
jgi:peptidoglycan-N-acetylglucosamine deacetylase